MIFKTGYSNLLKNLEYVTPVVEDKLIDESARNIMFKLTKTGVSVIGYSLLAVCRAPFEDGTYSVEFNEDEISNGVLFFQIKAKELNNFLGTFKSLNRTAPSEVCFDFVQNKVRLTVTEVYVDADEENQKTEKSVWLFDNIPVKPTIRDAVELQANKDSEIIFNSVELLLYINSMLPLLSDEGNSLPSKLNFCEDYVCAVPNKFVTLFKNELPDVFKGISLNYSAVSFLRKILNSSEVVRISKTDTHISISTDYAEAFITYLTKLPEINLFLQYYNKEHVIVVDRLYLKDVLKRLSIVNENAVININHDKGTLLVSNSKFTQEIPILNDKGMDTLGNVSFKLATDVIGKAIIGDDAVFTAESTDLRIYIVPSNGSGYMLYVTDAFDMWFSVIQVR